MDILHEYDTYLKNATTQFESDAFTRQIIKNYYEEESLKAHWKTILEKRPKVESKKSTELSSNKRIFIISTLVGIAASLMLVFYINKPSQQITSSQLDQLLEEHYTQPITRNIVKGDPSLPNTKNDAYKFYQNKEYKKSILLLEQIIERGTADEEDHFFLGLAHLYDKNPKSAIIQFDWILAQPNGQRHDYATWHLALALVDAQDFERAKIYLTEVTQWDNNEGQREFAKKAQKLKELIYE